MIRKYIDELRNNLTDVNEDDKYYVYILFDNREAVYVGKTIRIGARIEHHKTNKVFDQYSYIVCDDALEMDWLEGYLILQLQPKYNKEVPQDSFISLKRVREHIKGIGKEYKYNPKYYVENLKKLAGDAGVTVYEYGQKSFIDMADELKLIRYALKEDERHGQ